MHNNIESEQILYTDVKVQRRDIQRQVITFVDGGVDTLTFVDVTQLS
jgi:hypothetical protein